MLTNTHGTATFNKNAMTFLLLALMPLAAIAHGSLAFWSEHFELSLFGASILREGHGAQVAGLITTSLGWMALWMLSPLLGMPKRGALAMGSLAAFWMLLFFAMSA